MRLAAVRFRKFSRRPDQLMTGICLWLGGWAIGAAVLVTATH